MANQLQETGSHLFCQKRVGVLIYKHQLCQLNDVMIRLTNAHTPSHSKVSNGTLAGSQINPADAKPRERFEGLLNRTVRITCNFQYPPTPAFAKAGAAPGTTGGVEPALSRPWRSLQPVRWPLQGNSRSYTLQPSVFSGVQACCLPALNFEQALRPQFSLLLRGLPSVVKGVQGCRVPALKSFKGSAGASTKHSGHSSLCCSGPALCC